MSFIPEPMQTAPAILQVDQVTKKFGDTTALEHVSLTVRDGEFLTLLGPSGCGKTTLIRIIAGFEAPTSGRVLIDGRSIVDEPPYRRPIGMVFQNLALFPHLTVFENIAYGLRVRRVRRDVVAAKVEAALEMVALPGYGSRYTGEISGGQRQRVALARAVITEPRVLLLDEPLGALDLKIRRQMQIELKQIQEKLGTTFIFVTHDQEEALTMSDRVAIFRNGAIDQIDTPKGVYERPATRFVAEFVGDTNFIPGTVRAGPDAGLFLEPQCTFPKIKLFDDALRPGQSVGVSIRPQSLRIAPATTARVSAVVKRYAYTGQLVRAWLDACGTQLISDWHSGDVAALPEVGDTIGISWDDKSVVTVDL